MRLTRRQRTELKFLLETCTQRVERVSGRVRVYLGRGHWLADKSGWVWKNRLIVQIALGRKPLTTEHVHHINLDKTDDRIENYEVIDCVYHGCLHASGVLVADFSKGRLRELREPIGPFALRRDRAVIGGRA